MKRAVILAGGQGERLRPLTQDRPKCMVDVLGSPILAYQLQWLAASGITQITVACGYMHELIESHFGSGSRFGVNITYSIEEKPLGRGGALKKAMTQAIGDEASILCLNGDNICNVSIKALTEFHHRGDGLATIVTAPLRSPYGIVQTSGDNDVVVGFQEKPQLPYRVNAGIYAMSRDILPFLPDQGDHEVTAFPQLASQGKLRAFNSDCFWRTVDTVKDVNELRNELQGVLLGALFQGVK
jgi:NDP-sugar pyrophosphorylase family protein